MKLRQTDAATRRLRDLHPFSWKEFLPTLRLLAPLMLFIGFSFVDIVLMTEWKNWMSGKEAWLILPIVRRIVGSYVVLGFGIGGLALLLSRISRPAFETDQKGLLLRDRKNPRVHWKELAQVIIEPVAKADKLVKVVFHVQNPRRRTTAPRPWSIILDRAHQLPELIRELRLRHAHEPRFLVRELEDPLPPSASPAFQTRWFYIYLFGFWLLIHGAPLLLVGRFQGGDSERIAESSSRPRAEFRRFMLEHFSSPEQFRRALVLTGAGIAALGIASLILGSQGLET